MKIIDDYGSQILEAFWTTIQLTIFSAIGALILGVVIAAMRVSPVPVARFLGAAYVTVFRNTPLTLILLFCVFGLCQTLDISLASTSSSTFVIDNNFRLAILGLSVYTASFVCESIRAGINTVHAGQAEAGRSLGLTFLQNLRLIVLPQAFRAVIAPLGSVLIALTKNSTVAAVIGVPEASKLMKEILENEAALFLTAGIFAVGFVILTLPTGLLFGKLAKKFEVAR